MRTSPRRARKRRAELARYAVAKATVVERDGGRCRCCNLPADDPHHLKMRSQGGANTTDNLVLVCRWCHEDIHARRILVDFTDANDRSGVTFTWTERAWNNRMQRAGR